MVENEERSFVHGRCQVRMICSPFAGWIRQKELAFKVCCPWNLLQGPASGYPTDGQSRATVAKQQRWFGGGLYPWGRAKSLWFAEGMMVPVDETEEAEEAEDESSSIISGSSGSSSASCRSSGRAKGSVPDPILVLAHARCNSLMVLMLGRTVSARGSRRAESSQGIRGANRHSYVLSCNESHQAKRMLPHP